ncbi:MAG: carboxypeptidase regulatory-like domain-containing protein, partial [Pseudomonadota bacterium]|nr:carboxypeptidase regulatory-like domain-containing protein [Pseudomonadota bacterium]
MSFKRLISTAAITSSFCFAPAHAAEVVFYITEDGSAADAVSVAVNGQRQIVNPQGFVTFELPADSYIAELSQYGAWVGEADFTLEHDDSSEDVFVEILGGEAIAESSSSDGTSGVITGQLISNETGGPVSGARVSAAGTDLGVITDDDGAFSLELPRGNYTLTVAHPSYQRTELSVNSMPGVPVDLNVEVGMSGNGVIEEVVAVGTYVADSATSQ